MRRIDDARAERRPKTTSSPRPTIVPRSRAKRNPRYRDRRGGQLYFDSGPITSRLGARLPS